ncbi:MAG: Rpn family recombination-promoting nuclease/putative transposase, partial [Spirochaetales bacterium]|nr:Rpn family recombination-promoting nuclease/putative transposase [Spirochaetales bacterium]
QYTFHEYGQDLFSFIPAFDYLLVDLSELTDKEIKDKLFTKTALRIGLLIQKNIFDTENLRNHLKDFLMLGKLYYGEEKGTQFLESVLRYLSYASDITFDDVEKSTRFLPEPGREVFMTLAEQLIEKGEIIDKQNILIKQISRKFGVSDPEKIIIKETDSPEILDAALDIILFAKSKSEVISVLEKT